MIFCFEDFELDTDKVELRAGGAAVAIEPQVFELLALLLANRQRMVSKDEIVAKVWDGRAISDAAIASRIKSARQALGDDGRAQRLIRTVHGLGLRFVGEVTVRDGEAGIRELARDLTLPEPPTLETVARPSIAVLPFRLVGVAGELATVADAVPHDLITELSRLHWLFVIARASSFQFRGADADISKVRAALNVRYCLSGIIEVLGREVTISVELCDTHDCGVVWSDRYKGRIDGVHEIREEIVRQVVNALELQIPLNEARRARLKAPDQLDAWSAYHLGLQHMFRFNKADNVVAAGLFQRAVTLDPGFSRAYAGLSFTHFQDAFLGFADDIPASTRLAQGFAEKSLACDPMDPFGNFAMGRTFWLVGDLDASLPWLDRANTLNPNYAQARYARAWVESLLGQGEASLANVDTAIALSPLDPMIYAMCATRGFSHVLRGEMAEAADWAERGARAPGAHALVEAIAVLVHGLNGEDALARYWAESARRRDPSLSVERFFRAFPFRDQNMRQHFARVLSDYGF